MGACLRGRLIIRRWGLRRRFSMTTAWTPPGPSRVSKVANTADRKEFVSLIGEALGSTYQNRLLPILRDNRGRFSCLGKSQVLPPKPFVGRYASLLPHSPLPQEARAIVNLLLERRGLVIHKEPFQQ